MHLGHALPEAWLFLTGSSLERADYFLFSDETARLVSLLLAAFS